MESFSLQMRPFYTYRNIPRFYKLQWCNSKTSKSCYFLDDIKLWLLIKNNDCTMPNLHYMGGIFYARIFVLRMALTKIITNPEKNLYSLPLNTGLQLACFFPAGFLHTVTSIMCIHSFDTLVSMGWLYVDNKCTWITCTGTIDVLIIVPLVNEYVKDHMFELRRKI